jgi:hypothetical protein
MRTLDAPLPKDWINGRNWRQHLLLECIILQVSPAAAQNWLELNPSAACIASSREMTILHASSDWVTVCHYKNLHSVVEIPRFQVQAMNIRWITDSYYNLRTRIWVFSRVCSCYLPRVCPWPSPTFEGHCILPFAQLISFISRALLVRGSLKPMRVLNLLRGIHLWITSFTRTLGGLVLFSRIPQWAQRQ